MLIIGYTTRKHLLLDLDNTTYPKVRSLVTKIMQAWPEVGDVLVLRSSGPGELETLHINRFGVPKLWRVKNGYHLVFSNLIGYRKCCRIIRCLADLGILNRDYAKIRKFRGDMTLRVSPRWDIDAVVPPPTPIKFIRNRLTRRHQDGIRRYLSFSHAVNVALSRTGVPKAVTRQSADHADDGAEVRAVSIFEQSN